MFTGTLCGKWPDIGVWACLVGMKDKHGLVDCTPQYLAGVLGLEVEALMKCIERFMAPDDFSRTRDCDGRRLELIDPARPWGWRVINHQKYREKARLSAKNEREVATGENSARMSDRRVPPETAADPLSEAEATANAREDPQPPPAGLDPQAWNRWQTYRREIRKPIKPASVQAAQRKLAGFGADQAAVVEQAIAQGWTGLYALKDEGNGTGRNSGKPRPSAVESVERATADWAAQRGVDPASI